LFLSCRDDIDACCYPPPMRKDEMALDAMLPRDAHGWRMLMLRRLIILFEHLCADEPWIFNHQIPTVHNNGNFGLKI
jgi:hypothetical protein